MTGKIFITFFFISAAFCFGIGDAGFDETYAKQMVNFAAASFIAPQTINNTDFANQCFEKSFPNGQWDKAIHYSVEPCAGYFNDVCQLIITRSVPLKMVVIAFRGTVGKAQMDHEADDSLLEYEDWHYNASFGSVNKYFYAASETLWTNYVENTIKDNKGFKIAFTGHSLGGAIASLTALKARHLDIVDANLMTLYTFGEPRIGDSVFASNYRSLVKESYRIIHNSDLVPHMPLCDGILSDSCGKTPKKPYHQPQEIWYNNKDQTMDNSVFTSCDENDGEDKKCSNSISKGTFLVNIVSDKGADMHLHYYDHKLDEYGPKGCNSAVSVGLSFIVLTFLFIFNFIKY